MSAATSAAAQTRSLYRRLLRELPANTTKPSVSFSTTPLRESIRSQFLANPSDASPEYNLARRQEVDQAVQYLKAQRTYLTLLARYNPGADMDEEERVRLTARRVGMEMPEEWYGKGKAGKYGIEFDEKNGQDAAPEAGHNHESQSGSRETAS